MSLRKGKLERPADHQHDEALFRHPGGVEGPLGDAVAEDANAVGDAEHLRQPVADVDDADPGPAALEDKCVEALDVLRSERRRRLVQEEDLRVGEQRLDDLEELPLGERQRPHRSGRWNVELKLREPLGRPLLHPPVRRLQVTRHREAEVLRHREIEDVRVGLVGHPEAELPRLGG